VDIPSDGGVDRRMKVIKDTEKEKLKEFSISYDTLLGFSVTGHTEPEQSI
jgi:hypothetical protein